MSRDLMELAIDQLDFRSGQLFDCCEEQGSLDQASWIDKGDWLKAAQKAGAEKIFFVDNNPVVVFARSTRTEIDKITIFNKIWCLSRPRFLFLEMEGELSVLDLAQAPIHFDTTNERQQLDILETLTATQSVAQQLQHFHRDNIESGKVFSADYRFGNINKRADQALIANLKTVRKELMESGLSGPDAHALIGRSIFIRYLEDRGILTEAYFLKIAESSLEWQALLQSKLPQEHLDFSGIQTFYARVLRNKLFTYALFRKLSEDFNGDMFPNIDVEESHVQEHHLQLLQDLLYGDSGAQKKLFFFSYKFDIIPLDLISAIYEEFYHASSEKVDKKGKARQDGAYYTPPALAEFVLSRLLTLDVLKQTPRVLDPACGSGIFLVEAFRRMVRYRISQGASPISFDDLKQILGKQIAGIEVNEEAARITAFSLYLAMLHYLDPPSINEHIARGNRLPNLIANEHKSSNHFHNLHVGNAFAIDGNVVGSVDVVVGNPPWGSPGKKADQETRDRQNKMLQWCEDRQSPIGDKEPSQAFLWRATDFLKPNGRCALLVSAGVLFKHSSKTRAFRTKWMSQVCITEVFNFTNVCKFFFHGANSPFLLIHFRKSEQNAIPVEYLSPKEIFGIKETRTVLLTKYDRAYLFRQDLTDKITWKVNWFGRHADMSFIRQISKNERLSVLVLKNSSGRGYEKCGNTYTREQIGDMNGLESFERYSAWLDFLNLPSSFYRIGCKNAYFGKKLLVLEGIQVSRGVKGRIIARYENDDFAFSRSIYGIKLISDDENQYLAVLGILWSSFARYFFFNTSANWGVWHDKILLDELYQLPIPPIFSSVYADKVISIVQKLKTYHPQPHDLLHPDGLLNEEIEEQRRKWEAELDEAVYHWYGFSDEQRDLIRDCCDVTLPFLYQPYDSIGTTTAVRDNDISWMQRYAERFAQRWQPYLNKDEILRADLHIGASGNMVAMEFYPADAGDPWKLKPINDWSYVLDEIGKVLPHPMGTSKILLDGIVHILTDHSIIVIKRNEKRFWTRSLAREDAESTLAKRMFETMQKSGGIE